MAHSLTTVIYIFRELKLKSILFNEIIVLSVKGYVFSCLACITIYNLHVSVLVAYHHDQQNVQKPTEKNIKVRYPQRAQYGFYLESYKSSSLCVTNFNGEQIVGQVPFVTVLY